MNKLIKDIQTQVESITINNDDELVNANELAKEINQGIKDIKAEFKPLKDEANRAHKAIVKQEKQELEPWENARKILRKAISDYMLLLEEKHQKEIEAQKEAEELFGISIPTEEPVKLVDSHFREEWAFEITDPDAVPIKYGNKVIREIDMKALREIAKYEEGQAKIDGVRFYKKKVLVQK